MPMTAGSKWNPILAFTVSLAAGVLPENMHAAASIYQPRPGTHVGVPVTGESVEVQYQGFGYNTPFIAPMGPMFIPIKSKYSWTRDGGDSQICEGPFFGPSCTVTYLESTSTRGGHALGMREDVYEYVYVPPYISQYHWKPGSAGASSYVVQNLPTAEIVSAPEALLVYEPGWFEGSGTVDSLYSKSKTPLFTWDFDDGTKLTTDRATKFYTKPGVYDVSFTTGDGTFSETIHKSVRVQGVNYETYVLGYLGHFQLGNLSDLEPSAGTAIGDFQISSGSSRLSVVPGLVATENSAGAVKLPMLWEGSGESTVGFALWPPRNLTNSTLEFWMKVDGPLNWPTTDPLMAPPELRAEVVRGPGWVLTLTTTPAQAGGHFGQLKLYAAASLATAGMPPSITGPVMDFSVPHMVTITDIINRNVPVYGLYIDGISYGVLPNPTAVNLRRVQAFWPQPISKPWGTPASGQLDFGGHYRDAEIVYDEAVLYSRLVTPAEAVNRYRTEAIATPPSPLPEPLPDPYDECRELPTGAHGLCP